MSPKHLKIATALVVLVCLMLVGIARYAWQAAANRVKIPDEKVVGVELLAEKLTGPGYFSKEGAVDESGTLWAEPDKIAAEFDRVVRERKFGPDEVQKLKRIIRQLTEAPSSRIVGGERINLVRLNLALDTLRE